MMRTRDPGDVDDLRAVAGAIASAVLHEPAQHVAPIVAKGSVNQVFVVATPAGRCVVRINGASSHAQYRKEAWCIERAAAAGIPGPLVLGVGTRGSHAYMVQTFVAGENGADSPASAVDIWRTLGRHARTTHGIATEGFGEALSDGRAGSFTDTWPRFLAYNIESLRGDDPLLQLGVMTSAEAREVRWLFRELGEKPFRIALNHGDLALRNTLVDRAGRVSLIDWGCAEAHIVPHFDLNEIRRSSLAPADAGFAAFLEGYGLSPADYGAMLPDLDSLGLLRAVDKLRWALDRMPARVPPLARAARQAVQHTLGGRH